MRSLVGGSSMLAFAITVGVARDARASTDVNALVARARAAAAQGRCDSALDLAAQVEAADPPRYARDLTDDVALRRCRDERAEATSVSSSAERVGARARNASIAVTLVGGVLTGVGMLTAPDANYSTGRAIAVGAGVVAMVVGPTVGRLYGGDVWNAGLGVRLAAVPFMALTTYFAFEPLCDDGADCDAVGDRNAKVAFVFGAIYVAGSVYEIVTTKADVTAHQRRIVPVLSPTTDGAVAGVAGLF